MEWVVFRHDLRAIASSGKRLPRPRSCPRFAFGRLRLPYVFLRRLENVRTGVCVDATQCARSRALGKTFIFSYFTARVVERCIIYF